MSETEKPMDVTVNSWTLDHVHVQQPDASYLNTLETERNRLQQQLQNDYVLYDVYLATQKRAEQAEAERDRLREKAALADWLQNQLRHANGVDGVFAEAAEFERRYNALDAAQASSAQ